MKKIVKYFSYGILILFAVIAFNFVTHTGEHEDGTINYFNDLSLIEQIYKPLPPAVSLAIAFLICAPAGYAYKNRTINVLTLYFICNGALFIIAVSMNIYDEQYFLNSFAYIIRAAFAYVLAANIFFAIVYFSVILYKKFYPTKYYRQL
jgi:hypothetical protein